MESSFWQSRWAENQIGFHEGRVNVHLERYFPRLVPGAGETVFVPLCGKTEDLAWLAARGHRVVGVEWVESAVRAFFEEHQLTPTVTQDKGLTRYEAQGVVIFAGDFFSVTPAHLGGATVVYDRAAMIALPAPMRDRYVKHLRAVMPAGARGLLVTVSYDQTKMDGPPFSVTAEEVARQYTGAKAEPLETVAATGPRFVTLAAQELVFSLGF